MDKSTINGHFHSYVSLPEGKKYGFPIFPNKWLQKRNIQYAAKVQDPLNFMVMSHVHIPPSTKAPSTKA